MNWLVFAYSLPSKSSSARVNIWRRLAKLGAVSPTSGLNLLPDQPDHAESFTWLLQEVRAADGDGLILHVDAVSGLDDAEIVTLFQGARAADYAELEDELALLELSVSDPASHPHFQEELARLQGRYLTIQTIDFFDSAEGIDMGRRITGLQEAAYPADRETPTALSLDAYREAHWVTRPRPHVDRLASIWLIRRRINPNASIRFAPEAEPGEVSFDMQGADFGHVGNLCTFEVLVQSFGFNDRALTMLAQIIHDIDLHDTAYGRPEGAGVDRVLRGWLLMGLSDAELEDRGLTFFDALYTSLSASTDNTKEIAQ